MLAGTFETVVTPTFPILPDSQNPLREVNRPCFLVKLFLGSHSGFRRESMQGYLDVFSVIMNPPEEKMEKAATVLDLAMRNPKTLRFRKLYENKSRPDSEDQTLGTTNCKRGFY